MKDFIITLTATSIKEFAITAETFAEAHEIAQTLFFDTDLLSFSDDDLDEVDVEVKEITDDDDEDEDFDLEEMFFSASEEQKERILNILDEEDK
jgi:Ran GTPase-activating protein (RanGAP) involved in mRNA processing and transport